MSDKKSSPGLLREANEGLSIRGSIRSSLALSGQGLALMRSSARALADDTKRVMRPGRNETFDDAMARLGLSDADLPLVHNQLMLQAVLVFCVSLLALFAAVFYAFAQGRLLPALIAAVIAIACAGYSAQASFRAFSIRRRELGNWSAWLASPDEWLVARLGGCRKMNNGDPMVKPGTLNDMAAIARRRLYAAGALFVVAVVVHALSKPGQLSSGALIFFFAGAFQVIMGLRDAFAIYRGRQRRYYDLMAWVTSPSHWLPKVLSAKELEHEERALARRLHRERAAIRAAQAEAREAHGAADV
jgi:hypothetical protein